MTITREIVWWYHALVSTIYNGLAGCMSRFASFLIKIGLNLLEKGKYHVEKL